MPDGQCDEREEALRYAAGLKGLSLLRTGDTFALVIARLSGATLDQIADYLAAEGGQAEHQRAQADRRADLRALLKAEHAIMVEFDESRRRAVAGTANGDAIEAVLAEIRRRLVEIDESKRTANETSNLAWQEIKHSLTSLP
jgi:hypothetical protein